MLRIKMLTAALLCVLLTAGCTQADQQPVAAETLPAVRQTEYKVAPVVRDSFTLTLDCNANYVFPNAQTVTCPYNNAIVTEKISYVEEAEIRKGDVIAKVRFDASPAELERLELECYQANLNVAKQIESYESKIRQYESAAAAGGIDGEIAALQLKRAQNELKIYKENSYVTLAKLQEELEAYEELFTPKTIVAPEDGYVMASVSIEEGTVLKEGTNILTYTTGTPRLLQLYAPSQYFQLLATTGMEVTISRGKQKVAGKIVASPVGIADQLDNQYIYVDSPDLDQLDYRSYYGVECTVLSLDNVLMVNSNAIYNDGTYTYVMILENGQAVKREVMCGLEDDGMTCILAGLEEGQQAILNY